MHLDHHVGRVSVKALKPTQNAARSGPDAQTEVSFYQSAKKTLTIFYDHVLETDQKSGCRYQRNDQVYPLIFKMNN